MATETAVPATLTRELLERLSAVAGQPAGVAEVALSVLSYGSLASLIAHGIIEDLDTEGDEGDELVITNYGRRVIEACAEHATAEHDRLTPELIERLAALDGQPDGVAEIAMSAMSYDALESLVAHGIIDDLDTQGDEGDEIVLTDRGREVISACARMRTPAEARPKSDTSFELTGHGTGMHLGAVARCEGPVPTSDTIVEHIRAGLGHVPRCRQRLAGPLGELGPHFWVDDGEYDDAHHVRYATLSQGSSGSFEQFVGTIFSQDLDRSKPLWEIWIVDGLEDGGFALVSKVDPALLEGVGGIDLLATLFDLWPDARVQPRPTPPGRTGRSSTIESAASSLTEAVRGALRVPRELLGAARHPARTYTQVIGVVGEVGHAAWAGLHPAPKTPMNRPIGADRHVAFAELRLSEVKAVKDAFHATVNDVVLAAVAGALRSWMQSRDAQLQDLELRALSFAMRGVEDEGPLERRIVQTLAPLPVHEPDPVERLLRIRAAGHRKAPPAHANGTSLLRAPGLSGTTILALVRRLSVLSRYYNLIVANLRGSPMPLYVLGRRLESLHPILFLEGDHALAIGAVSHEEDVYFGLMADSGVLPDVEAIAAGIEDALGELLAAAASTVVAAEPVPA